MRKEQLASAACRGLPALTGVNVLAGPPSPSDACRGLPAGAKWIAGRVAVMASPLHRRCRRWCGGLLVFWLLIALGQPHSGAQAEGSQAWGAGNGGLFLLFFRPGKAMPVREGTLGARNQRALQTIAQAMERLPENVEPFWLADRRQWCANGSVSAPSCKQADAMLWRRVNAILDHVVETNGRLPDAIVRGRLRQGFVEELAGEGPLPSPPQGAELVALRLWQRLEKPGRPRCPALLLIADPALPTVIVRRRGEGRSIIALPGATVRLGERARLRLRVLASAGRFRGWWERAGGVEKESLSEAFLRGEAVPAPRLPATLVVTLADALPGSKPTKGAGNNPGPLPPGSVHARLRRNCRYPLEPVGAQP